MFLTILSVASAASVSAIPTSVKINNSQASGTACEIVMSGTTYIVDDVAGNFGATCLGAMMAREESKSVTLYYNVVGADRYAYGLYAADTTRSIDYIYTNDATGTASADQCKGYFNGSAGNAWYYVDDGGPEEDMTCAAFFAVLYSGRGWSVTLNGSEIQSFMLQ